MVGDIIWALLPFTDLSGAKLRPVLVVADVRDARELDWIVCEVTRGRASHSRELALASSDLHSGQLRRGSKLRPDRMFTLNESLFRRTIGRLTDAKISEILSAVRALFKQSQ